MYRDPEFSWAVPVAPTALSFVASRRLGCALQHDLLVGDNNCGNLYRFHPNAARDGLDFTSAALLDRVADNSPQICSDEMSEILYGTGFGTLTDMVTAPGGDVDLVAIGEGRIYRLSPNAGTFPDADGDGVDDACDCAPAVPSAAAVPAEVPRLRMAWPYPSSRGNTALAWDRLTESAGSGTRATVVGGDLGLLRADNGYARACDLTFETGPTLPPFVDGRPEPATGYGYFYLVRAGNACGEGTYGDGDPGAGGGPDPRDALDTAALGDCPLCLGRVGGAIITFGFPPSSEILRVWITNGPFIDTAKQFLAAGTTTKIPIFTTLLDGRDCDSIWTWHPDPEDVSWAIGAIEVCDGLPSGVEADKDYWFQIGYCPWAAQVIAVQDER
jgi:hypothetical protein